MTNANLASDGLLDRGVDGVYYCQMIKAAEINRGIDLSLFSSYLMQQGLWHSISESGEKQVIWVRTEEVKERVLTLYGQYSRREFALQSEPVAAVPPSRSTVWFVHLVRSPLALTLVLANVICFPVTMGADMGNFSEWLKLMTFTELETVGGRPYLANLDHTLASGQYWRLLTPMFLHFGWLHIVFNMLWTWELGRRIEWVNGRLLFLLLVVITSLVANLMQYLFASGTMFGGMSGVVYGLLGFSMVWRGIVPKKHHGMPDGVYIFMLGFLLLGFTGVLDFMQPGDLANGAHLGGLFAGIVIGLAVGIFTRLTSD